MASQITNYQCPACTGPLHFDSATGTLICDYCGSAYSVKEIEDLYAAKDQQASEAHTAAEEKAEQQAQQAQAAGFEPEEWGAEADGMKVYNCPSCGAELICDATTAATSCPYCGNPTIVPGQFTGGRKPDLIIPFKLDKEAALSALKEHYKGKWLLPKEFSDKNHLEEIKGIYVPFWLYDGSADADIVFDATNSTVIETRNERITRTDHYIVERSGTVDFQKVPVDGSSKMPDDHMDAIEPFNYEELRPFSTAYLPGYLADKYDVDAEAASSRADDRCRQSAIDTIASTVTGYMTCVPRTADVKVTRTAAQYALLPVWLLSTKWNDQNFLFAMNGQTGKLIGDLPVSKKKFWLTFFGIFAPLAAIMAAITYLL